MLFWRWESAVPAAVCEQLISEMSGVELIESKIRDPNSTDFEIRSPVVDKGIRRSKHFFLNTNHWFEGILFNHVRYANQSLNLNYDITGCERVQFTIYEKNSVYHWHADQDVHTPSSIMRKLTAVCLLSDPADFSGGGTVLKEDPDSNILRNRGDIVVFPSYLMHSALEVTDGTRMTAVLWANGPAFK